MTAEGTAVEDTPTGVRTSADQRQVTAVRGTAGQGAATAMRGIVLRAP